MAKKQAKKKQREWPEGHREFMQEFRAYTPEQKKACIEEAKKQIEDLRLARNRSKR